MMPITRSQAARQLLLVMMTLATITGCAVITVDVDVYKGPLANQEDVQVEQIASVAVGARPILLQLRESLGCEVGKDLCEASDSARENFTLGKGGAPCDPCAKLADSAKPKDSCCGDEPKKTEKDQRTNCCNVNRENRQLIQIVDQIIGLYESKDEALDPTTRRLLSLLDRGKEAARRYFENIEVVNRRGTKLDQDLLRKTPASSVEAEDNKVCALRTALRGFFDPPPDTFRKVEQLGKAIADVAKISKHARGNGFDRATTSYAFLLKSDQLNDAIGKVYLEAEDRKIAVARIRAVSQAFLDARAAVEDMLELALEGLTLVDCVPWRSAEDKASAIEKTSRFIVWLTHTTRLNDGLKELGEKKQTGMGAAANALDAKLGIDPKVRYQVSQERLYKELLRRPVRTACLLKAAHKESKDTKKERFGLAVGSSDDASKTMNELVNLLPADGAPPIARRSFSLQHRARLDEGIYDLIDAYLVAADELAKGHSLPQEQQRKLTRQRDAARERLFGALVRFSNKVLIVANFQILVESHASERGIVEDIDRGSLFDSETSQSIQTYTTVLQAIGNSILNHIDSVRDEATSRRKLEDDLESELTALQRTLSRTPNETLNQILAPLPSDHEEVVDVLKKAQAEAAKALKPFNAAKAAYEKDCGPLMLNRGLAGFLEKHNALPENKLPKAASKVLNQVAEELKNDSARKHSHMALAFVEKTIELEPVLIRKERDPQVTSLEVADASAFFRDLAKTIKGESSTAAGAILAIRLELTKANAAASQRDSHAEAICAAYVAYLQARAKRDLNAGKTAQATLDRAIAGYQKEGGKVPPLDFAGFESAETNRESRLRAVQADKITKDKTIDNAARDAVVLTADIANRLSKAMNSLTLTIKEKYLRDAAVPYVAALIKDTSQKSKNRKAAYDEVIKLIEEANEEARNLAEAIQKAQKEVDKADAAETRVEAKVMAAKQALENAKKAYEDAGWKLPTGDGVKLNEFLDTITSYKEVPGPIAANKILDQHGEKLRAQIVPVPHTRIVDSYIAAIDQKLKANAASSPAPPAPTPAASRETSPQCDINPQPPSDLDRAKTVFQSLKTDVQDASSAVHGRAVDAVIALVAARLKKEDKCVLLAKEVETAFGVHKKAVANVDKQKKAVATSAAANEAAKKAGDELRKAFADASHPIRPGAVHGMLLGGLQKSLQVAEAATPKDAGKIEALKLAVARIRAINPPTDPLESLDRFTLRDGDKKRNARDVLDQLIKVYEYEHLEAVKAGGNQASPALRTAQAIKAAYDRRAGMVHLRSAMSYLRDSMPATDLTRIDGRAWKNNLAQHMLRQLPFADYLGSDARVKVANTLDKRYWHNVNRVRVAGGGNTNYAIVKDDVGNWYVKGYSADPEPVIKSAQRLAMYSMGAGAGAELIGRVNAQDRARSALLKKGVNPDSDTAAFRDEYEKQLGSSVTRAGVRGQQYQAAHNSFAGATDDHLVDINEATKSMAASVKAALANNPLATEVGAAVDAAANAANLATPAAPEPVAPGATPTMETMTQEKAGLIRGKIKAVRQFYVTSAASIAGLGETSTDEIDTAKTTLEGATRTRDEAKAAADAAGDTFKLTEGVYERLRDSRIARNTADKDSANDANPSEDETKAKEERDQALAKWNEERVKLAQAQVALDAAQVKLDGLVNERQAAEAAALVSLAGTVNQFLKGNVERRIDAVESFESAIGIIGTGGEGE